MIEIKNICKSYGRFKVLNGVSLSLHRGECVALVGPNGCGKTTLIKCILGLTIPNSGGIKIDNESILGEFNYRKMMGYMPQVGRYPENMKVKQIFEMIKSIQPERMASDNELYEKYDLACFEDKKMRTLSGGMTQKVSASLAFLFNPDILILDEPTAGLDPLASEIIKEKIERTKNEGKLILITSHLLSELDDMATEIVFMQEGRIYFHKSVDQLRQESSEHRISKAVAQILRKENEKDN